MCVFKHTFSTCFAFGVRRCRNGLFLFNRIECISFAGAAPVRHAPYASSIGRQLPPPRPLSLAVAVDCVALSTFQFSRNHQIVTLELLFQCFALFYQRH